MSKGENMTIRERTANAIAEIDPNVSSTDEVWPVMAFMIGAVLLGPDPHLIAEEVGLDLLACGVWFERASVAGIFKDGAVASEDEWMSGEAGGLAFNLDVAVLLGAMTKSGDKYRLTEAGEARVRHLGIIPHD